MAGFTDIVFLLSLPVLLVGSAFFSGTETALFSLTRHQRHRMARSGAFADGVIVTLLGETRTLLITLLLANMTVNVGYFVISTLVLMRAQARWEAGPIVMGAMSVTSLMGLILLGEVLPKMFAARRSERWAAVAAAPLWLCHRGVALPRRLLDVLFVSPLARLLAPRRRPASLSAGELEALLDLSRERGVIDHQEESLLQDVLELGQRKVRDLMTPRVDIVAFDRSRGAAALIAMFRETHHSRMPVYERDLDHIVGVVSAREVLLSRPSGAEELGRLVRQVSFVPEVQRADQLLVHFRRSGTTLAIVVDEYGGTAGLVTLEDVVEEMVGQITDPDEPSGEPEVQAIGEGHWRVSADLAIHEWTDLFEGPVLGDTAIGAQGLSTVGGLVMAKLGRVPREGDVASIGNIEVCVESMAGHRIGWLSIRLRGDGPGSEGEQP